MVIDYLNGEPGIFSASIWWQKLRYQRADLVFKNMNGVESIQRGARFISVICGIGFYKEPLFQIDTKDGINGFGYDPIFIPGETTASMSKDEKNNISHRRKSIDKFL